MSKKHYCAQRGCNFDVDDVERPAELAEDGVTVVKPAETIDGPTPELCPVCGHPFIEHPASHTL